MGYYTQHCIEVDDLNIADFPKISDRLAEISGYSTESLENGESIKWYDHEENMLKLSKEYPTLLFTVGGEGEESGDSWVHYYRDGKVHKAEITRSVEKFDPEKLK